MAVEHGHPYGGRAHPDRRVLQDPAGLPDDLHLLPGVAVVLEPVDLRDAVERYALGHRPRRPRRPAAHERDALLGKLFDRFAAGSGDGLVGRHLDALDAHGVVDGLEGHDELDGRAVGISDDAALVVLPERVQVDLRDDEGDVLVVAELGRIVDDDAAGRRRLRRVFLRDGGASAEQPDLRPAEVEVGQLQHGQAPAAEGDGLTQRTVAGQGIDLPDRKVALLEHPKQRFADQPRGPDDRDIEGLFHAYFLVISGVRDFTSAFCARWRR